ncbi:MAG: NAD(P)-binding domain-containing protein [Acidimicrobiales bacterium]
MTRRITVLGTGLMGGPIATTLAGAGFVVTAYNRTAERAEALRPAGVEVVRSVDTAVDASPTFLTMLTDAQALESVVLQTAHGRLEGRTLIQMP